MNIKRFIPIKFKAFIKSLPEYKNIREIYSNNKYQKKIFVLGTPHHGNLGDQAIAYAEIKFLQENFKEYEVIEVNISEYYAHFYFFKKCINLNDIIVLHGGGNLGNEYIYDENIRRDIIQAFPQNKIILFPQTMYFTKDTLGREELNKSKEIYSQHRYLTLIAREKISYEAMKEQFNNNKVLLAPDIVLYLDEREEKYKRSGAMLCLRNDVESKLNYRERQYILRKLEERYGNVNITDTLIKRNVSKNERNEILKNKWNEFKNTELVITDRIHGMIFAAITGTPCIALSNYNHKVKGTYEWIKDEDYIKYIDDLDDLEKCINDLKKDKFVLKKTNLKNKYTGIVQEIENGVNNLNVS